MERPINESPANRKVERVETSEQRLRLSTLLKIAQNGARTLTVLTMPSTKQWETYVNIDKAMNETAGMKVVTPWTTQGYLYSIEPLGLVAKSTLDDMEWSLTDFGIKIKPVLIFTWQRLLDLGVDPISVFGNKSQSKVDSQGNIVRTTSTVRVQILRTLSRENQLRIVDLARNTDTPEDTLSKHLQKLEAAGLVTLESADLGAGQSVVTYQITERGSNFSNWPIYTDNQRKSLSIYSPRTKEAIDVLAGLGIPITTDSVTQFIKKKYNRADRLTTEGILSHFAREGLLARDKFYKYHYSDVSLTFLGRKVVEQVVEPLVKWSQNIEGQEINDVGSELKVNQKAYLDLFRQIAISFCQNSPDKNANKEAKIQEIKRLIVQNPGQLTVSIISRLLNLYSSSIRGAVEQLIKSGEITPIQSPKSHRTFFSPVSTLNPPEQPKA